MGFIRGKINNIITKMSSGLAKVGLVLRQAGLYGSLSLSDWNGERKHDLWRSFLETHTSLVDHFYIGLGNALRELGQGNIFNELGKKVYGDNAMYNKMSARTLGIAFGVILVKTLNSVNPSSLNKSGLKKYVENCELKEENKKDFLELVKKTVEFFDIAFIAERPDPTIIGFIACQLLDLEVPKKDFVDPIFIRETWVALLEAYNDTIISLSVINDIREMNLLR